jgi:hypothetical protein
MELAIEKLTEFNRMISAKELAYVLFVSEDTVRRYWQRGIIPGYCGTHFGDVIRFDPRGIQHWLMNGELPSGFQRHPAFNDLIEVVAVDVEE